MVLAPRLKDAQVTAPGKQTRHGDEYDGAHKGDDHTLQVEASHHQVAPEDEATNVAGHDGADDAQDDVAHEPEAAAHELTGQPAGDQAHDKPGQNSHTHRRIP